MSNELDKIKTKGEMYRKRVVGRNLLFDAKRHHGGRHIGCYFC